MNPKNIPPRLRHWGLVLIGCIFLAVTIAVPVYLRSRPALGPVGYAQLEELDPILAFPGVNTAQMADATENFKISAEVALPQTFGALSDNATRIFPFQFLEQIPKTEDARRRLLSLPTQENIENYHAQLIALFTAYNAGLKNAETLLNSPNKSGTYIFFSGETTARHLLQVLNSADIELKRLREKEDRRYSCYKGISIFCESTAALRNNFGGTIQFQTSPNQGSDALPKKNAELLSILTNSKEETATSSTPVELTHSVCYPDTPTYFAVGEKTSRLSGIPAASVVYLDDIFVYDVTKTSDPFFKAIQSAGGLYPYQAFNIYLCPDVGEDTGTILTMLFVHRNISDAPFTYAQGDLPPDIAGLKAAQTAYENESMLTSDSYDAFIGAAANSVRLHSDEDLDRLLGEKGDSKRLEELVVVAGARSAYLEDVLGYFDDLQLGTFLPYQFNPPDRLAFFVTRGGISQLDQLSNRTGLFPNGVSLLSTHDGSVDPYKKYSTYIRSYENDLRHELSYTDMTHELTKDVQARAKIFNPLIDSLRAVRTKYINALAACAEGVARATEGNNTTQTWNFQCLKKPAEKL